MTDHNLVVVSGAPVHERLEAARTELVPAMLERLIAELPVYGRLPDELVESDLRQTCDRALRMFIDVLRTGVLPAPDRLARLHESAARRAEEGIGLGHVLSAYYIGARVCLDHVGSAAVPGDLPAFLVMNRTLLAFLQAVTAAAADGFTEERNTMIKDDLATGQALTHALLEGTANDDIAARAGVRLPTTYFALTLTVGPHADEGRPDDDPRAVGRRKLQRLREELSRHVKDAVLWIPSDVGGLALVPCSTRAEDLGDGDWQWLDRLVAAAQHSAQARVTATVAPARWNQVAGAAQLSRELMDVVMAAGRPPGLYQLCDVALEYQLSRPSPARQQLAELLDPLKGHLDLLMTLRSFVATDLNRRQTAKQLHVHPNTIDNRLRKIVSLIELDPAKSSDLQRIGAALAARGTI